MNFSISGTKYTDVLGNDATVGIGADDTVLNGIKIDLFDSGNLVTPLQTVTTSGGGKYEFDNLGPLAAGHHYVVQEELPGGYVETFGNAGYSVTPTSGQDVSGDNFANFKLFNISGTKYLDANDDGSTAGDAGLGGIKIFIDIDNSGTFTAGDISTTTAANGTWSLSNLGPSAVGHSVLEVLPTGYVETVDPAYTTTGANHTGIDFANYKFVEGSQGLTQGFWSTHSAAWDGVQDTTWGNIVDKPGGLIGNAFTDAGNSVSVVQKGNKYTGNDDILLALHKGGILLGDANGDGNSIAGGSEFTQFLSTAAAVTDLGNSSAGNATTIMLNQLIAAQLNIYNGDNDPGSYHPGSQVGHDLVGEGVMWLNGLFSGTPGATSAASWTAKTFDTHEQRADHSEILVSGQDLKNVLQAFNQNQIVTSADDKWVGWSPDNGVTILGIHANTPDAFWLVAQEHGVIA